MLTPRVKATHVTIDTMQDYLDAVYDVTVAYEATTTQSGQRKEAPSMTGEAIYCFLCGRYFSLVLTLAPTLSFLINRYIIMYVQP